MRLSLLSVFLLLLTFGAAGAAEAALDKSDEVNPHNNVGRMPGGLVIRAFSFDLVEAKKGLRRYHYLLFRYALSKASTYNCIEAGRLLPGHKGI